MENMRKLAEAARQVLLGEASFTVTDLAFDRPSDKKKLMDRAKKGKIKVKELKGKTTMGGDMAATFSGSDADLIKFGNKLFGLNAKNLKDLQRMLGQDVDRDGAYQKGV
tara:strand:- start:742 stop:1068 length:327 start_codon:yes stop_codon:yes gene_type:complete